MKKCKDNPIHTTDEPHTETTFADRNFMCAYSELTGFEMKGSAFSANSSTIRVTIDPCKPDTSTSDFKIACAEQQAIDSFMRDNILVVYVLDQKLKHEQNEVVTSG